MVLEDALSEAMLLLVERPEYEKSTLAAKGDFALGVCLAVNHSGDSDSTGAITGNILGALLGREAIPVGWLERVKLREVVTNLGIQLRTVQQ